MQGWFCFMFARHQSRWYSPQLYYYTCCNSNVGLHQQVFLRQYLKLNGVRLTLLLLKMASSSSYLGVIQSPTTGKCTYENLQGGGGNCVCPLRIYLCIEAFYTRRRNQPRFLSQEQSLTVLKQFNNAQLSKIHPQKQQTSGKELGEEKMSRVFYLLSVLFGNILLMDFYGFLTFQFHSN